MNSPHEKTTHENPAHESNPHENTSHPPAGSPAAPPQAKPARRKLDDAAKEVVCQSVADGCTLAEAAEMVGVSERSIYRERRRDEVFRLRLSRDRQKIAGICVNAARDAAQSDPKNWRAGEFLYKVVYPDRYYARPGRLSIKDFDRWNAELMRVLESILTADQMRQLHERMAPITHQIHRRASGS
jgi:hypothetical protein